ncbi:sensor histidine kinase [Butyrivibrio sp. INlla16]|uniref:sensor histidine kinase n=1 Tax=Butyrivibrio sp. INlla16 TaxID=1520807 RepID=UPI000890F253|nr:sensor histidine kinase [Butyrivibrio sp. INlla16]SDB04248.1 GHKL domain-containing protein [Butyrivibrio sp. INlla16]
MTEQMFRIVEECYGIMIILVRGILLGFLINAFISDDVMDRAKKIVISVVITAEGATLFVVPFSTRGAWTIISLLTILAVFYFYDKRILPHIVFVYFLWQNMFFVWYIMNIVLSDYISIWFTQNIDYSQGDALAVFYGRMMVQMALEIVFLAAAFIAIYFCIEKICVHKRDMSWTEALYLSIYSGVSYVIAYLIAEVMVVPLEKEVFILLDEKKNLKLVLPILAILIFIGEMSAIATWQRYRRLKEEELLLQEQVREQEFLRKKIEYTEKHHDQIRTLRHDMAGKLMILKSFIENNRYQDASQFLSEMDIELNAGGVKYSTGNPVTDVVINEAASQAEKLGCSFDCDFSFPVEKNISAMDMAIVLNNLLDNALEAVVVIPEEDRFIKISGTSKDNFYLVKTENSYDGKVIRGADNSIVSKKKDASKSDKHGIGLKSVMQISDKYLGVMDVKTENKVFEVKVMLQNTGN